MASKNSKYGEMVMEPWLHTEKSLREQRLDIAQANEAKGKNKTRGMTITAPSARVQNRRGKNLGLRRRMRLAGQRIAEAARHEPKLPG